ncbi:DUF1534 domain-containing protein [Pseudomonas syringae]|nr:DUF1534 domain-containing protein [Pseudomonas syringae]
MAGAFGRYDWEDAERPERHTHAEHGHDRGCCGYREQAHDRGCCGYRGAWAWLRYTSFLTLQRGNAFHDALRHSLSRSAMPMRRMGVAGGCVTGLQPATSTRIASRRRAAFSSMARPCSR